MATHSWHSARTGRLPTPSPLQQQSIDRLQQKQQQAAIDADRSGASSAAAGFGGVDAADWSALPYSLTSLIQNLVARESELSRQVHLLKLASEELKREQSSLCSHAAVREMTVGTASLQKEFGLYRAAASSKQTAADARILSLENTVSAQAAQLASFASRSAHLESSVSASFDSLRLGLASTQSDSAERGLIAARAGDKVSRAVQEQARGNEALSGRLAALERRVGLWEFAPSSSASASASPIKQRSAFLVTKDSIQSRPPGTALALAAIRQVAEGLEGPLGHGHGPLASEVEAYARERGQRMGPATGEATPTKDSAAAPSAIAAAVSSDPLELRDDDPLSPPRASLLSPRRALASSTPPPNPHPASAAMAPGSAATAVTVFVAPTAGGEAVSSPSPTQSLAAPSPSASGAQGGTPAQLHRYMADYTTRNLQRDLLEIAETYQSTIRNEVDGLRSQLLSLRRNVADEAGKTLQGVEAFEQTQVDQARDVRRAVGAVEASLHSLHSDLTGRMAAVEGALRRVDSLSSGRAHQLELLFQTRNTEVVKALTDMQGRMDDAVSTAARTHARSSAQPAASTTAADGELLERLRQVQAELVRVRKDGEESARALGARISSVQAHTRSLFAEAVAQAHGHARQEIAPEFDFAPPAALSSAGPQFSLRPKSMESGGGARRSRARAGGNNITAFESDAAYKFAEQSERPRDSVQLISQRDEEKTAASSARVAGQLIGGQVRRPPPLSASSRTTLEELATPLFPLPFAPGNAPSPRSNSARTAARIVTPDRRIDGVLAVNKIRRE